MNTKTIFKYTYFIKRVTIIIFPRYYPIDDVTRFAGSFTLPRPHNNEEPIVLLQKD